MKIFINFLLTILNLCVIKKYKRGEVLLLLRNLYNNLNEKFSHISFSKKNGYPEIQFSHIFGGSTYSAGYYSYLWSEIYSADAFKVFKEFLITSAGKAVKLPTTGT